MLVTAIINGILVVFIECYRIYRTIDFDLCFL